LPFAGVILAPSNIGVHPSAADHVGDQLPGHSRALEVARDDGIERRTLVGQQARGRDRLGSTEFGEGRIGLTLPAANRVPGALAVS
jgi:hypothetical protein